MLRTGERNWQRGQDGAVWEQGGKDTDVVRGTRERCRGRKKKKVMGIKDERGEEAGTEA